MIGKNPEITVVMRSHNSEKYVDKAIKSALNQTLSDKLYEVLVIDDGSKDKTREILSKYKEKIRIIEKDNIGQIPGLNYGVKNALGKYIILLDADDTFEPNALKEMYTPFTKNKNIDFVYSDYFEYFEYNEEKKLVSLKNNIFNSVAGGILFKKVIFDKVGFYDESLIFPEYDLLIKVMENHLGKYISKPLFTYVRHQKAVTANQKTVEKGLKQIFEKYGKNLPIRKY